MVPTRFLLRRLALLLGLASLPFLAASSVRAEHGHRTLQQIIVPGEDRFQPFALTIRTGDTVKWVNMDTDDHTVVSDDFFNDAGHQGTDQLVPGTDNNGGQPGTFELTFHHRGTFVYYCKFHSHLDDDHQPVAPGPRGGIQSDKDPTLCDPAGTDTCDFGTPMMGVITVRGDEDGDD
jgi:plastocyanin